MTKLKKGDTVSVLDEALSGTVIKVNSENISIETKEGFILDFNRSELVLESALNINHLPSKHDIIQKKTNDFVKKPKRQPKISSKKNYQSKLEVDLHIHKLTDSSKGMTNFDMLNLQLETAKRQLEFAQRKRIQKVVFIHGVGQGVLKMELETLFKRFDGLKFYDADYTTYGYGATEIYFYQNPNKI